MAIDLEGLDLLGPPAAAGQCLPPALTWGSVSSTARTLNKPVLLAGYRQSRRTSMPSAMERVSLHLAGIRSNPTTLCTSSTRRHCSPPKSSQYYWAPRLSVRLCPTTVTTRRVVELRVSVGVPDQTPVVDLDVMAFSQTAAGAGHHRPAGGNGVQAQGWPCPGWMALITVKNRRNYTSVLAVFSSAGWPETRSSAQRSAASAAEHHQVDQAVS
jgi:hypothetical protein